MSDCGVRWGKKAREKFVYVKSYVKNLSER